MQPWSPDQRNTPPTYPLSQQRNVWRLPAQIGISYRAIEPYQFSFFPVSADRCWVRLCVCQQLFHCAAMKKSGSKDTGSSCWWSLCAALGTRSSRLMWNLRDSFPCLHWHTDLPKVASSFWETVLDMHLCNLQFEICFMTLFLFLGSISHFVPLSWMQKLAWS